MPSIVRSPKLLVGAESEMRTVMRKRPVPAYLCQLSGEPRGGRRGSPENVLSDRLASAALYSEFHPAEFHPAH
jgi:hypothetical protein